MLQPGPLEEVSAWGETLPAPKNQTNLSNLVKNLENELAAARKQIAELKKRVAALESGKHQKTPKTNKKQKAVTKQQPSQNKPKVQNGPRRKFTEVPEAPAWQPSSAWRKCPRAALKAAFGTAFAIGIQENPQGFWVRTNRRFVCRVGQIKTLRLKGALVTSHARMRRLLTGAETVDPAKVKERKSRKRVAKNKKSPAVTKATDKSAQPKSTARSRPRQLEKPADDACPPRQQIVGNTYVVERVGKSVTVCRKGETRQVFSITVGNPQAEMIKLTGALAEIVESSPKSDSQVIWDHTREIAAKALADGTWKRIAGVDDPCLFFH